MNGINVTEDLTMEIVKGLMKQKEAIIFEQLQELISRGLLVVEETEPVLVCSESFTHSYPEIKLMQSVKLKLKDQEYVEKLEARVKELEKLLTTIQQTVNDSVT